MEIFSVDRHGYDYDEDADSNFGNCLPPYRGLNLITHALEWVNANSLSSQGVEIDSEPMSNKNEATNGDMEPTEVVSNSSDEVLEKRDNGNIVAGLASFDPTSIVEYVSVLGKSPNGGVDEFEIEVAKAQLLAFSSWRGHSQLPEFSVLCGNLRCDVDAALEQKEHSRESSDDAPPGFEGYRRMHDLLGSFKDSPLSNVKIDEHIASRAACFCSMRLMSYLKGLGGLPCGEVDKSELAVAKAQLLAFTNWKGYSQLPEFTSLNGYLASDTYLANHNMVVLHNLQSQTDDLEEKSNERWHGDDACRVACFDTMLDHPFRNIANLKWVREEYCCSDLVDDAPPGFENYRMISESQINLNEELNRINEEEVVCTTTCFDNMKLIDYLKTLSKSPLGQLRESELMVAISQLQAFFCWKGFSGLPEFTTFYGSLDNVSEMGFPEDETCRDKINLNEELNRINEEDAVCTMPYVDNVKLIGYLRTLSKSPLEQLCESEFIKVKSHIQAFFNWKGFSQPLEFTTFSGSLENVSEMGLPEDETCHSQINLNEELNRINEEDAVCTKPYIDNVNLIGYVRTLSKSPLEQLCESEFIKVKSHLQAFFSWKGCTQLPKFTTFYGSLESVSEKKFPEDETCLCQLIVGPYSCFCDNSGISDVRKSLQNHSTNLSKTKQISDGSVRLQKRKKSSSFFSDENRPQKLKEEMVYNTPCSDNMKLIGFLRAMSKSPLEHLGGLELMEVKSILQAFVRWKGFSELPQFTTLNGSLQNVLKMGFREDETCHGQLIGFPSPCVRDYDAINDARSSLRIQSSNLRETKQISKEAINCRKRKKGSSSLLDRNRPQKLVDINGLNGERELMSSCKNFEAAFSTSCSLAMDSLREDLLVSSDKSSELQQIKEENNVVTKPNEVALEHLDERDNEISGQKRAAESSYDAHRPSKYRRTLVREHTCSKMLSELLFTAINPLGRLNLSIPVVSFISQYKDSVASGSSGLTKAIESPEHISISETPSTLTSSGGVEPAGLLHPKDSCSSDYVVEKVPELQFTRNNDDAWNILLQVSRQEAYPSGEQQISPELTANVASEPDSHPGNSREDAKETIDNVEEDFTQTDYQTALVLTFINMAAVPSEGYLNKVFGCFGQLNEQETKVFNKRNGCRVVYRKRADAEAAFTSVGKHGIFRDTLLSYRLKYIHSKPAKTPSRTRRRNNDSASCTLNGIQSPFSLVDL